MDLNAGIDLADVPIAGRVIEMPMRIHDCRNRPATRLRVIEDRLGVLGMAAGIDHDQAAWRVDDHTIAVGSLIERHRTGDEMITRR